jgi:hypothetical protein
MKFTFLDATKTEHPDIRTYSDTYNYLDEFLDKTFITEYFMVRKDHRRDGDGDGHDNGGYDNGHDNGGHE